MADLPDAGVSGAEDCCFTVAIIDKHPVMREAMAMLVLRIRPGSKIVHIGVPSDLEAACLRDGLPRLVIAEINQPNVEGMPVLRYVKAQCPGVPLVVFTDLVDPKSRRKAVSSGADLFIGKDESIKGILSALSAMPLFADQKLRANGEGVPVKLTKRQRQLLTMLDTGKSNIEMSLELGLSHHTIKVHLWRLYSRFGVNTRIEALHYARANGWLGFRSK